METQYRTKVQRNAVKHQTYALKKKKKIISVIYLYSQFLTYCTPFPTYGDFPVQTIVNAWKSELSCADSIMTNSDTFMDWVPKCLL